MGIITQIGKKVEGWTICFKICLSSISGIPAMASYKFNSENFLKYKTLISQEMLKRRLAAQFLCLYGA